jgi:hypothetical protein
MKYKLYIDIAAGLLIVLFVYTALNKLDDHVFFQAQLKLYPLIGFFAGMLSWAIPVTELFISILLLIPAYKTTGLYAALVLLIAFTVYLLIMIIMTPGLPCSCGGVIETLTWTQHILFNGCFIIITLAAIILSKRKRSERSDIKQIPAL